MKHFHLVLILILCASCTQAQTTKTESDREHDGFVGPVKRVFVVWSPISGNRKSVSTTYREIEYYPDKK